ncbi:hypothetical protein BD413DRAFT_588057 [Trametes elegans]|nr:hypothetical protein BD413DRAFT_588057 [Trametes elegans]
MQDTRRGQRGRNTPAAAEGTASGRGRRTSSANAHPGSSPAKSRTKPEEHDLSAYTGVFSCGPGF